MLANLRGQAYSLNYLAQAALVEGGLVPFCFPRWPELARPRPTRPRLEQRPGYNAEGLPKGADALTTPPHTPLSFYIFKVPNGVGFLPPIFCGHPLSCTVLPLSCRPLFTGALLSCTVLPLSCRPFFCGHPLSCAVLPPSCRPLFMGAPLSCTVLPLSCRPFFAVIRCPALSCRFPAAHSLREPRCRALSCRFPAAHFLRSSAVLLRPAAFSSPWVGAFRAEIKYQVSYQSP